jgi:hypothetical protein
MHLCIFILISYAVQCRTAWRVSVGHVTLTHTLTGTVGIQVHPFDSVNKYH